MERKILGYEHNYDCGSVFGLSCPRCIAEKQSKLTINQVIKWGDKACAHRAQYKRRECETCWNELREAGIK